MTMHHLMLQGIRLHLWLLMGVKEENLMLWSHHPLASTKQNLWSIVKQKIYEGGRQFASKQHVWKLLFWI